MKYRASLVVFLCVAAALNLRCRDSDDVEPVATVPAAASEVQSHCPLPTEYCAFASQLESALRGDEVGALRLLARQRDHECPYPRPQGAGGPYPLCDDVSGPGQVRAGFGFANDSAAFVYSEQTMEAQVWERIIDSATDGFDWRLRTLACESGKDPADCTSAAIAFGKEDGAGRLVGEPTQLLAFQVSMAEGDLAIDGVVSGFAMKDAPVALNGGPVDSPAHLLFFSFREFHPWSP